MICQAWGKKSPSWQSQRGELENGVLILNAGEPLEGHCFLGFRVNVAEGLVGSDPGCLDAVSDIIGIDIGCLKPFGRDVGAAVRHNDDFDVVAVNNKPGGLKDGVNGGAIDRKVFPSRSLVAISHRECVTGFNNGVDNHAFETSVPELTVRETAGWGNVAIFLEGVDVELRRFAGVDVGFGVDP